MKLRYEKRGEAFFPQFHHKTKGWLDIKKTHVGTTVLAEIAQVLGTLSIPNRWKGCTWYDRDKNSPQFESIIFSREIYVMAFLGAVQSWFVNRSEDFNLEIQSENDNKQIN